MGQYRGRVLLVEDQRDLAVSLLEALADEGYQADYAADGRQALTLVREAEPRFELLVVDIGLPRLNGLALCEQLRSEGLHVPVLFLTARDSQDDVLQGFAVGADDYLVKPFAIKILLVRIAALLRRSRVTDEHQGQLSYAGLRLAPEQGIAWREGMQLALSPIQTKLLTILLREAPKVVSREQLLLEVWGEDSSANAALLRAHVYQLRQVIDRPFAQPLLCTRGRQGFYLTAEGAP